MLPRVFTIPMENEHSNWKIKWFPQFQLGSHRKYEKPC